MSRSSRSRTLLILLSTLLVAGPAIAQDKPDTGRTETKAAGQWTDPPARAEMPATNAASPKPMATPAKIDGPAVAGRPEARPPRRSAKLRRAQIRTVAIRTRPARVAAVRRTDRPSRRVVTRISTPPQLARGPARSVRPVYGIIPPDAPAHAYYEQRRFGTVGNRPSDLGLTQAGDPAYRTVGLREGGHLIMRWRGAGVPAGVVIGQPSPFNPFGAE